MWLKPYLALSRDFTKLQNWINFFKYVTLSELNNELRNTIWELVFLINLSPNACWYEGYFEWWLWMEWQVLQVTEESLSIYHIAWSQDNLLNFMTSVIQWEFLQSLQMFTKQNIICLSFHIEKKKLSKTFSYIVGVLEESNAVTPWET